jgi:hypothetical protein
MGISRERVVRKREEVKERGIAVKRGKEWLPGARRTA